MPVIVGAAHLDLGRAVDDAQALDPRRFVHRQLKRDHAAHGQAHHVRGGQVQVFDQGDQVEGETLDAVALPGFIGTPMATHIHHDQAVMPGQHRNLQFPILAAGAQAVDQNQRGAVTIFLVMQAAPFMFEPGHA